MTTLDWQISKTTIIVRDPVSERVLALLTNPALTYSCLLSNVAFFISYTCERLRRKLSEYSRK